MKYESPTLSLMGQMEELTGSAGWEYVVGDMVSRCQEQGYIWDPIDGVVPHCWDEEED